MTVPTATIIPELAHFLGTFSIKAAWSCLTSALHRDNQSRPANDQVIDFSRTLLQMRNNARMDDRDFAR